MVPTHYLYHVALWLLLSLLYAGTAWLRRLPRHALVAGLALNFGLWVAWANHETTQLTKHPLLWLIPLALVLLATDQTTHERLLPAFRGALRELGLLLLLYCSSAADMFITGLGESALLPLVLALLAVLGFLVGISLRVRAYLAYGVVFLVVVIFAEIWHAAVDRHQTWVWWASGIVLGAAILALFALFEKRRNDLLRLVAEINQWE